MSRYRYDRLTDRTVLVAPHRAGLVARKPLVLPEVSPSGCPFCPGHERETEPMIVRLPEEGPWRARVVANRFPLIVATSTDAASSGPVDGGHHELVIECREHTLDWADFSIEQSRLAMQAIQMRVAAYSTDPSAKAVFAFRNRGVRAGSSQPHAHTQIVALPWTPAALGLIEDNDVRDVELGAPDEGARRVLEDSTFIAIAAYAPTKNHHVRIFSKSPLGAFDRLDDSRREGLADVLRRTLITMTHVLGPFDYNVLWRLPSRQALVTAASGWFIDIVPRISGVGAGFELATDIDVITVAPETAAEALRSAIPVS